MIVLPAKRQKVRSGILRGPKLHWQRHEAFIRRHTCIVTAAKVHDECNGPIQCCHYRTAANSGVGVKPGSWWTFPACMHHHAEQHRIGEPEFQRKYGLDLESICQEFVRLSPDQAMKEAMREYGIL